jgi:hypothetical protein
MQTEAAPIEHAYAAKNNFPAGETPLTQVTIAPNEEVAPGGGEAQANPTPGVILRVGMQGAVREVTSDAEKLELRVEHGVANVNVHDPAKGKLILVDLPGGQTQLLKNGLYTFNAETNTARVLKGEALAFRQDAAPDAKPLKVKEYHKFVFNGTDVKPQEFVPYEASVDLLPGPEGPKADGLQPGYGYGAYDDGFYGDPYWAYGYPGWGYPYYPYGYGFYPYGAGLGFTYYGGFHGGHHGGYHGGDHGGYHGGGGGRFHGGGGGFHGGGGGGGFHGGGHRGR